MPHYSFLNKETEEEFDKILSIAELTEFLEENPHIKQKLSVPSIADSVRIGVTKPDVGFRELLDNMHSKLGHAGMNTTNRQTY